MRIGRLRPRPIRIRPSPGFLDARVTPGTCLTSRRSTGGTAGPAATLPKDRNHGDQRFLGRARSLAVGTAAVWTPAADQVTIPPGYGSGRAGNATGERVVLSRGDGTCGVIASIGDDGSVTPPDGGFVHQTLDCWASWAPTFSQDGSAIASAGTQGEAGPPILLLTSVEGDELARLPINDVVGQYFQPHAMRWLDSETPVLLASSFDSSRTEYRDEEWGIWRCDIRQSECRLAQAIAFNPTGFSQVALVDAAK